MAPPLPVPEPLPATPIPTPNPFSPPLTASNAPELSFNPLPQPQTDACRQCDDQRKRKRRDSFSGIIATVKKDFGRKMSQNSIDNLKRGR